MNRGLSQKLKTFGGCLNIRQTRNGTGWSTHSWGIAIDLNPTWNKQGEGSFELGEEIAKCFEEEGFIWGGRWTGAWVDAMHFQFAII